MEQQHTKNPAAVELGRLTVKHYTVTFDESEAHAVGFALKSMIRAKKEEAKRLSNKGDFDYVNGLVSRLESAYDKLDSAPEVEK